MKDKIIYIVVFFLGIYVVGNVLGSISIAHPMVLLWIIILGFIFGIIGLIKLPFDIRRIFRLIRSKDKHS